MDDGLGEPHRPGPHRRLVDLVLRQSRLIRDSAGHRPPLGSARKMRTLWKAAVRDQMRLAGQSRPAADGTVTLVVNQLSDLQEKASWFARNARLREAAIAETIAYWTGQVDTVPSAAAQRQWARAWSTRLGRAPAADPAPAADLAGMRSYAEEVRGVEAGWLATWEAWAGQRPQDP